ncbi:MAG: metallophosphoesterase [Syntrophomonadaceae bacterium]
MRSPQVIVFISVFLLLYGLVNWYIGLRGYQAIKTYSVKMASGWAVMVLLLALLFPLGRFISSYLPHGAARFIIYAGSYWMGAMYYLLLILLVAESLRLLIRWTNILPPSLRGHFNVLVLCILALVAALLVYGTWNSLRPVVSNYEITVAKKSSSLDRLRIVAVSDIHLGWVVGLDRLEQMVALINSQEPDLVVFPGDIIDEGVDLATEQAMPAVLQQLTPRLGSYACMGNHEYISGNAEATIDFLNRAGINVLRDQVFEITDGFYIIGRDDASRHNFNGHQRQDLSELMKYVDIDRLPVILLDHEPFRLDLSEGAGIDLQFSGHTHLGQLFPNNYITAAMYENDWGHLIKGNLQVIVSSGYGTWGPPVRIGNHPEIVNVVVNFAGDE